MVEEDGVSMVITPAEFYGVAGLVANVTAQEITMLDSVYLLAGWSLLDVILGMWVIELIFDFIMELAEK
jgi:hypothetical protein